MTSTLLIVQIVLAVLITISILVQKSSSMGLGAYSGSNDSLFGAKGPASFLARSTMILGLAFVINTLVLGYFYNEQRQASAVDSVKIESLIPAAKTNAPAAPSSHSMPAMTPVVPVVPAK